MFHCLPSDIDELPISEVYRMYSFLSEREENRKNSERKGAPRASGEKKDLEALKRLTPTQFKEKMKNGM